MFMKNCLYCMKSFKTYHDEAKYCSHSCYLQDRWKGGKCKTCGATSKTTFCSNKCRKDFWNKNEYHLNKKKRMQDRKDDLIRLLGGCCVKCGINDVRVLDIHHKDSSKKVRPPKLHYTMGNRLREWHQNTSNLELLCANCHRIHTAEDRIYNVQPLFAGVNA